MDWSRFMSSSGWARSPLVSTGRWAPVQEESTIINDLTLWHALWQVLLQDPATGTERAFVMRKVRLWWFSAFIGDYDETQTWINSLISVVLQLKKNYVYKRLLMWTSFFFLKVEGIKDIVMKMFGKIWTWLFFGFRESSLNILHKSLKLKGVLLLISVRKFTLNLLWLTR